MGKSSSNFSFVKMRSPNVMAAENIKKNLIKERNSSYNQDFSWKKPKFDTTDL
jgi:hypothetical protein